MVHSSRKLDRNCEARRCGTDGRHFLGQTAVSFPEVQQEALAHDATHRNRESDRNLDVIDLRWMRVFKGNPGILK